MKVGRNDPCPCGSGKKYKKCCIDRLNLSNLSTSYSDLEFSESQTDTSFVNIIDDDVKKISQVFSEYYIEDVVKAVFCINSWIDNRSALDNTLVLNKALIEVNEFGDKTIQNYQEFCDFFSLLSKILKINSQADILINDFGQAKIKYNGHIYPIILGTGHEMVYGAIQYLLRLADILEIEKQLESILIYSSRIINFLKDYNISTKKEPDVYFEAPTVSFFERVWMLFESKDFLNISTEITDLLSSNSLPIEKKHFFHKNNELYPLYNTSIIVDFYSLMLSKANNDQIIQHVNNTIINSVYSPFDLMYSDSPKVLYSVSVIKDNKPISKRPYILFSHTRDSIILLINRDEFTDTELKKELKLLNDLHENNELMIGEVYKRSPNNGCIGYHVPKDKEINIILLDCFTDITSLNFQLGEEDNNYFYCSALDIIYILYVMDNFEEFNGYLQSEREEKAQIIAFGGKSSHFILWKEKNHMISKGATEYSMLNILPGIADEYILEQFRTNYIDYPFLINNSMFSNPFSWNVEKIELGFYAYKSKFYSNFFGYSKLLDNKGQIFLTYDMSLFKKEDLKESASIKLKTIDELNKRLFHKYSQEISRINKMEKTLLRFMYIPQSYAESVETSGFLDEKDREYVFSDLYHEKGYYRLRYSVNTDKLLKDINNTKNKRVESKYLLELLKPLEEYFGKEYDQLKSRVEKDIDLPKEVDVTTIEIDYYYSDLSRSLNISDFSFEKARKKIAKICFENNIRQGLFEGKDATRIIRNMQSQLISNFEKEVVKYNPIDLHTKVLSLLASCSHNAYINNITYGSFSDVNKDVLQEIRKGIIDTREKNKRYARTMLYLLETNLYFTRNEDLPCCSEENLDYLLAYADWLVVLQDNADSCYYNNENIRIEVDLDYLVNVIVSEDESVKTEQILKRKYENVDYTIKNDEIDKEFLEKTVSSFKLDTGLYLNNILIFLQYLQREFLAGVDYTEIKPNVFSVNKEQIISDFQDCLNDEINISEIKSIIEFLTIDRKNLKMWKGRIQTFLPINEREQRSNRFDVKPLIVYKDNVIFSPVIIKELFNRWMYGLPDFYPPYEIGLDKLMIVLEAWKKRYEDQMVYDIALLFKEKGINKIWPNAELHSLDKEGNHPEELGDYDVIAIDEQKAVIWVIESKVLRKVGSIYEDRMQQLSFFKQHKDDEKFQRRIDYIKKNYKTYLESKNINNTIEYEIKPLMITNKVFLSRYKSIDFKIMTIYELEKLLNEFY